ncbi:MAG: magnesium/cobalt transporter CorA [Methanomicrobiales archaeon]|nr:magnesium/cobalt transporter CorA [Methanomicrobiales archaeon]
MSRHRRPFSEKGSPTGIVRSETDAGHAPVRITLIDYDATHFQERQVDHIAECIPFRDSETVTWINVDSLADASLIEELGRCFSIHPLILEDVFNTKQRPKLVDLDSYIYLNLKMLSFIERDTDVKVEHISIIFGSNYLISFQEDVGDTFDTVRESIRKEGKIRKFGPDYLVYALIDTIVDNYFTVMEKFEEKIEDLDEELVIHSSQQSLHRINWLKKQMILLRKSVWPLREVLNSLERSESPLIKEATTIYLRDLYDHTIDVIDSLESFRDMVSGMIDIYLSGLSYRMNEIMKVLTLIATIFIPLTFIVGIYGMNFHVMPELAWEYGYYAVWMILIGVVATMLLYFRSRAWI